MAGQRPTHRVVARNKKTGVYTDLAGGWPPRNEDMAERGIVNLSLDGRNNVRVKAKNRDGKEEVITSETHYIQFEPNGAPRGGASGGGDDDIEF